MLNPSLAPVRRAATFFGFMALSIVALSAGPAFQPVTDQSSTTIAQQRGTGGAEAGPQLAAVDPARRGQVRGDRAVALSKEAGRQEARLITAPQTVIR